jgi:hypothetical protein
MSDTIVLPPPAELESRIRACREELAALKRLHRLALAAQAARDARKRPRLSTKKGGRHEEGLP